MKVIMIQYIYDIHSRFVHLLPAVM